MAEYAGHFGPEGIEFPDGGHAKNTAVEVRSLGGTILITLYDDPYRNTIIDNPVLTDEFGNLSFYANPGRYLLKLGDWAHKITVAEDPMEPDVPTPEYRQALIDDASTEAQQDMEPPVNLVLLFQNALS